MYKVVSKVLTITIVGSYLIFEDNRKITVASSRARTEIDVSKAKGSVEHRRVLIEDIDGNGTQF